MKLKLYVRFKSDGKKNGPVIITKDIELDDSLMNTDILIAVEDFFCDKLEWGYDVIEKRIEVILPHKIKEKDDAIVKPLMS